MAQSCAGKALASSYLARCSQQPSPLAAGLPSARLQLDSLPEAGRSSNGAALALHDSQCRWAPALCIKAHASPAAAFFRAVVLTANGTCAPAAADAGPVAAFRAKLLRGTFLSPPRPPPPARPHLTAHRLRSRLQTKGLDTDNLFISHIQVNQAMKQRRRTYRAHGRVNPYMSCPCHIELTLSEKESAVKAEQASHGHPAPLAARLAPNAPLAKYRLARQLRCLVKDVSIHISQLCSPSCRCCPPDSRRTARSASCPRWRLPRSCAAAPRPKRQRLGYLSFMCQRNRTARAHPSL